MSQSPFASPGSQAHDRWLQSQGVDPHTLIPLPGDASTRRYFRAEPGRILAWVPDGEELLPFLRVQHRFARAGLAVPRIFGVSAALGLCLQEDLGSCDLKTALDHGENPDSLFAMAFALLLGLATAPTYGVSQPPFPSYDAGRLLQELALFPDWYLRVHRGVTPDPAASAALQSLFAGLVDGALAQPKVWVHRDFHARNLFLYANELVMIDFQDAVLGPWTYDLASLLWDRYWDWGRERREQWIETYRNRLQGRGFPVPDAQLFRKQTELLALQRNLKILGIFCRLAYRDGKREYLQFLPRFWTYLWDLLAGLPDGHALQQVFAPWAPDSRP